MTPLLRTIVLYLLSVTMGLAGMMFIVPFLVIDIFGPEMPFSKSPSIMYIFGHYFFIRGLILWLSSTMVAALAFAVLPAHPLRYPLLSLPLWAPLCYVFFYTLLVAE